MYLSREGLLWFLIAKPLSWLFLSFQSTLSDDRNNMQSVINHWHGSGSPSVVIYPKWVYINKTDTITSQVSLIQTHFHCVMGSCIIIRFIDLRDSPAAILTSPKLGRRKKKRNQPPLGTLLSLSPDPQNRCDTSLTHTSHPAAASSPQVSLNPEHDMKRMALLKRPQIENSLLPTEIFH